MIVLTDMPALTVPDLDLLISMFRADGGRSIVRAMGLGAPGNPVVFPKAFFGELKGLTGDKGARALIRAFDLPVVDVEIRDGALIDVDTPDAIEAAGGVIVS
ncbi:MULTISPECIES: NTP transferase domain-containing protein [Rhizobium]|uniref:CTP:molybdopterin cytidylyltransferase MocA n=1 Tax=Rhizobium paranaense TaxID=1650438 RepID=A0A7W9D4D6_9HYPH|nr:NTP transferase domain-containing protein [Rhizobium paranaense]MBB5577337.1 CTP:molybdopterin cytidylyltransferase MocA [Rhizobium paranaense]